MVLLIITGVTQATPIVKAELKALSQSVFRGFQQSDEAFSRHGVLNSGATDQRPQTGHDDGRSDKKWK
ncbi:hypothetical protein MHYP_G00110050 [Metynnis hypsauchen]